MPRITVSATILAGQSLSSTIDLSDGTAIFLHMPQAWTPANLTFQLSPDNVTFSDAVDMMGREIVMNVLPSTTVRLPIDWASAAAGFLKFRSGSRFYPIVQTVDRTIVISAVT